VLSYFETRARIIVLVAVGASLAALLLRAGGASGVAIFTASAIGLAGLAALVGEGTEQLAHRLGPRATGVVQSALGNLPEFFIASSPFVPPVGRGPGGACGLHPR